VGQFKKWFGRKQSEARADVEGLGWVFTVVPEERRIQKRRCRHQKCVEVGSKDEIKG